MSVKTRSWNAHARSIVDIHRLKDRVTSATEMECTAPSATAAGAVSVWAVLCASKQAIKMIKLVR